jgi:AcrR family transcriptional regulator
MSSQPDGSGARQPKRERGKQRVAALLEAAAAVFAEKGFEAATMTEIAARAGAPIGSLYQFFPSKEVLADTLVRRYADLLAADLEHLEKRAAALTPPGLVEAIGAMLLLDHPQERAVAMALAETMDPTALQVTFRLMLRRRIAAVLRAHTPALDAEAARDTAVVLLQLLKAVAALNDESGLAGRAAAIKELRGLAVMVVERRLGSAR